MGEALGSEPISNSSSMRHPPAGASLAPTSATRLPAAWTRSNTHKAAPRPGYETLASRLMPPATSVDHWSPPVVPNAVAVPPDRVLRRPHGDVPAHPSPHKPHSIWPTPAGIGISKDVWMLGIGLSLLADIATDGRVS